MSKSKAPTNEHRTNKASEVSRRSFIAKAAISAGAAVTALGSRNVVLGSDTPATVRAIKIPNEFDLAAKVPLKKAEFPMSGAEVFARVCKEEGLAALFCCPGNYNVQNAIALEGIPTYSGRHEGSMCHAADAFTRVTGEVAGATGTEGPGFSEKVCAIASSNGAGSPVL